MSAFGRLARALARGARAASRSAPPRSRRRVTRLTEDSPGRAGPAATVAVDPTTVAAPDTAYVPAADGDPDPGEVVWTWVPYEENDGRGKDRPTLVVGREGTGTVLAVPLTSQNRPGDPDRVSIGSGPWDAEERESFADVGRVLRVHEAGMRREATAVSRAAYDRVLGRLRSAYGWR